MLCLTVFLCATTALLRVLDTGPWHYELGGWAPPWGIEYVIDPLSAGMAMLVSFVATLVSIYADAQRRQLPEGRSGLFDSLFLLLVAGLLGIVVAGDMFNLYVFLEVASLAAYGLLSTGGTRAVVATFRYLLLGTIAASFYLLGVGYLYAMTGTLNMADLTTHVPTIVGTAPFGVAVTFIVLGLAIKMAVFPLHAWQPDAYAYAPAAVTGFMAAVMSKVSAYALFRILYFVLRAEGAARPNHFRYGVGRDRWGSGRFSHGSRTDRRASNACLFERLADGVHPVWVLSLKFGCADRGAAAHRQSRGNEGLPLSCGGGDRVANTCSDCQRILWNESTASVDLCGIHTGRALNDRASANRRFLFEVVSVAWGRRCECLGVRRDVSLQQPAQRRLLLSSH